MGEDIGTNKSYEIRFCLDLVRFPGGSTVQARGWLFAKEKETGETEHPKISITDKEGGDVPFVHRKSVRSDVNRLFLPDHPDFAGGFEIEWKYRENEVYTIAFRIGESCSECTVDICEAHVREREAMRHYFDEKAMRKLKDPHFDEDTEYLREHLSTEEFSAAMKRRLTPSDPGYMKFAGRNEATLADLTFQRGHRFFFMPRISIVVPVYHTPDEYLIEMIESVRSQTYPNWELCIADGSGDSNTKEAILSRYHRKESRIRYRILKKNRGISGNTNAAMAMAAGDFTALLDHDDVLTPDALFEVVEAINSAEHVDLIYSDEDKFSEDVRDRFGPAFKPDFDWDYFLANNYLCHLAVIRSSLLRKAGPLRGEFDGAQDYDLLLRCAERARRVVHIPKVLYHWRCHPESTAANPESKPYAVTAGRNAVLSHLSRIGRPDVVVADVPGTICYYREIYPVQGTPPVDIFMHNRGSEWARRKENAVSSVSSWQNFQMHGFSPEEIAASNADYLVFLDGSAKIIRKDWIEILLGQCQREEVGAAGGKTLYPDNMIDQAGMALLRGDPAGRILNGMPAESLGPNCRAILQQRKSLLSGACMMVKREVFEAAGGLDPLLSGSFWAADLCLRIRKLGFALVFDPNVTVYRDYPDEKEDPQEREYFSLKWKDVLLAGDPYYSPNFSDERADFSYRISDEEP